MPLDTPCLILKNWKQEPTNIESQKIAKIIAAVKNIATRSSLAASGLENAKSAGKGNAARMEAIIVSKIFGRSKLL